MGFLAVNVRSSDKGLVIKLHYSGETSLKYDEVAADAAKKTFHSLSTRAQAVHVLVL